MARGRVKVQVYENAIHRMFTVGGEINSEARQITIETATASAFLAPKRSGELSAGHRREVIVNKRFGVRASIYNIAEHALWVHDGTQGPIVAKLNLFMVIRPGPGSRYPHPIYAESVSGQSANPWMREAVNKVLLQYGTQATSRT